MNIKFNLWSTIALALTIVPLLTFLIKKPKKEFDLPEENILMCLIRYVARFGMLAYMCCNIGNSRFAFNHDYKQIIWYAVVGAIVILDWILCVIHYKKGNSFNHIFTTPLAPLTTLPALLCLATGILSLNTMLIIFSVADIFFEYASAKRIQRIINNGGVETTVDTENDDDTSNEENADTEEISTENENSENSENSDSTDE